MSGYRALAPAKVNLGLFVGPTRVGDGKHELVTVMQSISLADELLLEPVEAVDAGAGEDELACPGVPGPAGANLAAGALRAFRTRTGWDGPPQRLTIVKRIPIAAGLGGGSADAAAALRLAMRASGLGDERLLLELAATLGADVPAQVSPGRWLATGAGELLQELPQPAASWPGLLVLPFEVGLSSATVYAEADRLGLGRSVRALEDRRHALLAAWTPASSASIVAALAEEGLMHNDLEQAAVSLCPAVADGLAEMRNAGADVALVSGSGPTVVGLFAPGDESPLGGVERAESAAELLRKRLPSAICARPVDADFARVLSTAEADRSAG